MTTKYHCQKCEKRFVDWGAEKLEFKCPDCVGAELVLVGSGEGKVVKRPALKRKPRRVLVPVVAAEEEEALVPDSEDTDEEEENESEEETSGGDFEEAVVTSDVDDAENELNEDSNRHARGRAKVGAKRGS